MNIGEFIRDKREAKGLSRFRLATLSGISHTEINRIETGERKKPPFQTLIRIADVLEIPQTDILKAAGYDPDKNKTLGQTIDALTTDKQKDTAKQVISMIARNSDKLSDKDLDKLVHDVALVIKLITNNENT